MYWRLVRVCFPVMALAPTLFLIVASVVNAVAHTSFVGISISTSFPPNTCIRPKYTPKMSYPVQYMPDFPDGLNSANMTCGFAPAALNPAPTSCNTSAGDTVSVIFGNPQDSSQNPVPDDHKGPIIIYMARHESSSGVPSGPAWFKVYQQGKTLVTPDWQTTQWATNAIKPNMGALPFRIPSDIPSGRYLLRVELIALHLVTNQSDGSKYAEIYVGCADVTVNNGGAADPPDKVAFPGAYTFSDPG
eukprot:TRINITY_DN4836_c0_g1_i3.p1 TRINITY_DN4836_c0_g1~~TRINITY_DN4836_c0_g1_i3.p1  ORF type:complete len:246 (-),score=17.89 TRINITY_DN4836_c0_g1_i3:166-903(-)